MAIQPQTQQVELIEDIAALARERVGSEDLELVACVPHPLLHRHVARRPRRTQGGRSLRRRGGASQSRPAACAGPPEDPGLQPPDRAARLAVDPHHRRDRHRRHAVPGRLGADGPEPPRVHQPPRRPSRDALPPGGRRAHRGAATRRGRGRRVHRRGGHPHRGRSPDRAGSARRDRGGDAFRARRRSCRGGGLERHARATAPEHLGSASVAAAHRRRRAR